MSDMEQKRKFYRLKYPKRGRPSVRFSQELYHVTEVSEGGIRVLMHNLSSLYKGLTMKGVLSLHNDCEVSIEGAVLRFDNDEVIVQLKKGPSFKNMVEEQRHIKNVFPRHFERLKMQAA
ncbi:MULTISPECIES: PilZ domain-containing protein [Vibrio]|uniref:Peptide chain release factor A n=1 Tax=Vibrio caribbeanicus TaxID=701175 RepID=A0ACC4P226_9VIBR|nr:MULTISPECIES: PilZ domain-containing protein [Vibrio]KHD26821.1 peptide chain release factor A [Vibrio caribbeanicus]CAK4068257.1 hypothetical protein VDT1_1042 [Vibrio sp. 16]